MNVAVVEGSMALVGLLDLSQDCTGTAFVAEAPMACIDHLDQGACAAAGALNDSVLVEEAVGQVIEDEAAAPDSATADCAYLQA